MNLMPDEIQAMKPLKVDVIAASNAPAVFAEVALVDVGEYVKLTFCRYSMIELPDDGTPDSGGQLVTPVSIAYMSVEHASRLVKVLSDKLTGISAEAAK
jgi:hypothetical protein